MPTIPWMRPPSKRLLRDQYSMGSAFSGSGAKPGITGFWMKIDTHSSNSSESPMTHLSADAIARTSSRQVRTAPTKSAWSVVMTSSSSVSAVVCGQADHSSDRIAHATYASANSGSRRHCTRGRTRNQRTAERMPPAMVRKVVGSWPMACTQAVPDSAMKSTKMHQARSRR